MKIKSLFFASALLAGLTFASCSKDNDGNLPGEEDNTGVVAGEETYATFSVNVLGGTRAFHGTLTPTAEEATIDQLTVYIYDVETSTVEATVTFANVTEKHTVKVTVGPKKFVATSGMAPVWNVNDVVADIENVILDVYGETFFNADVTKDNEFWMTSNIVNQTVVSATKDEVEKQPGHYNNITLDLGRAMAKIGVVYDKNIDVKETGTGNNLGKMENVVYRIKNQPNKMYLFTGLDLSGVWKTPYFDRNGNLWSDSHKTDYWHQTPWHSTETITVGSEEHHKEPSYMMENSNMTARYGNATYVSIEGVFLPNQWLDPDGTSGSAPVGTKTFWRVAKVDFESDGTTVKEIKGWKNNKIYNARPDNDGVQYDPADEAPIEYTDGKMYYWIYLDKTLGQLNPTNSEDKYTQRRNEYWDVEINSVTGLGWSEEDGGKNPDPEPLDSESWIQATINVLDWVPVSMPGDLVGKD